MSNKVRVYKQGMENEIYPSELEGYKKNGWSDKKVEPVVKAVKQEVKSKDEVIENGS